jgi:hypothetical protein
MAPPRRRPQAHEAPKPPWGDFPLVELCALAAIVLGVWGILHGGRQGFVLILAAMLLGSVAGMEVAIREHFGGYRSHSLVLAGTLTVAALGVLFLAHADRTVMLSVAAAVLALGILGFRALFKRRSGGPGFRMR